MSEDSEAPPGYPAPATLYKGAVGLLLGAAVFLVAIVLAYTSEPRHLHGATWLGYALGVVLVAVLAGFVVIQVRLRHERRRRSAIGGWLALVGVVCILGAGSLSSHANATYGRALLVTGFGVCLGLGGTALYFARHPVEGDGS
jgi:drug/metabolite transporter (DMT)-like permease